MLIAEKGNRVKVIHDFKTEKSIIPFGSIGTVRNVSTENIITLQYVSEYSSGKVMIPIAFLELLTKEEFDHIPQGIEEYLIPDFILPGNRFMLITGYKKEIPVYAYGIIKSIKLGLDEKNDMVTVSVGTEEKTYKRDLFDSIATLANDDAEEYLGKPNDLILEQDIVSGIDFSYSEDMSVISVMKDNKIVNFRIKEGLIDIDSFSISDVSFMIESMKQLEKALSGINKK